MLLLASVQLAIGQSHEIENISRVLASHRVNKRHAAWTKQYLYRLSLKGTFLAIFTTFGILLNDNSNRVEVCMFAFA